MKNCFGLVLCLGLVCGVVLSIASAVPANAGYCKNQGIAYCKSKGQGDPNTRCMQESMLLPECKMKGAACYKWCDTNKPGSASCREDCASRR